MPWHARFCIACPGNPTERLQSLHASVLHTVYRVCIRCIKTAAAALETLVRG